MAASLFVEETEPGRTPTRAALLVLGRLLAPRRRAGTWASLILGLGTMSAAMVPMTHAAQSAMLPILVYHQIRVDASGPPDSLEAISLERFESQMRYLKDHGYATLSTREAVAFVRGAPAPATRVVAIHFDDGWKSALKAVPILDRYGFKATFWIIAGKGIGWPHMDWDEVEAIASNPRYEVESHTMTHPWKDGETMLDWLAGRAPGKGAALARWELAESRRVLEQRLGHPVRHLAWPRGLYDETLIGLATEAGYEALFTIDDGVNRPGDTVLAIRRTMVHGGCDERAFAQLLRDGVYRACEPGTVPTTPPDRTRPGREARP